MKAQLRSKLDLEKRTPLQDVIPLETPFLLYVDPSSACNFRCQFCPTGHLDLLRASNYKRRVMDLPLFEKLLRDLDAFPQALRVMRMNKIGEPLLNRNLPTMIRLAKESGRVRYIDFATNASVFSPELLVSLVKAGLDRLNISLEGVSNKQYAEHANVDFDFQKLVDQIRWLYPRRDNCEVTIKVPGDYLSAEDREKFFDLFGDYCDRIFIEELSPIWPEFDLENRAGVAASKTEGQYRETVEDKDICTYIFYAMAINADGTVSACCPDWNQKLVVGDLKAETLRDIWHSPGMSQLRRLHLQGRRRDNPVCGTCGHIKYSQIDNIDPYRERLLAKLAASELSLATRNGDPDL
jgi:radical SAM protein with 4Fe4S-binding SPASM domain